MLAHVVAPEADQPVQLALLLHSAMVFVVVAGALGIVAALTIRVRRARRHADDYFAAINVPVLVSLPLGIGTFVLVCCHHHHVAVERQAQWMNAAMGGAVVVLLLMGMMRVLIAVQRSRRVEAMLQSCKVASDSRLVALAARLQIRTPLYRIALDGVPSMTVGRLRPWIAVSGRLVDNATDDELGAVVCHEEAHARGNDNLKRLVTLFSRTVLCWLPTMHWLTRAWDEACELRCDDHAVHRTQQPLELASALLKETRMRAHPACENSSAMATHGVASRVRRLLDGATPGPDAALAGLSTWLAAAAVSIFIVMRANEWIFSLWCLVGRRG